MTVSCRASHALKSTDEQNSRSTRRLPYQAPWSSRLDTATSLTRQNRQVTRPPSPIVRTTNMTVKSMIPKQRSTSTSNPSLKVSARRAWSKVAFRCLIRPSRILRMLVVLIQRRAALLRKESNRSQTKTFKRAWVSNSWHLSLSIRE